jgi:hypothetical protein
MLAETQDCWLKLKLLQQSVAPLTKHLGLPSGEDVVPGDGHQAQLFLLEQDDGSGNKAQQSGYVLEVQDPWRSLHQTQAAFPVQVASFWIKEQQEVSLALVQIPLPLFSLAHQAQW